MRSALAASTVRREIGGIERNLDFLATKHQVDGLLDLPQTPVMSPDESDD